MFKIIFLVLCSFLATSLANPTWYPDNEKEVAEKCDRENNVTPEMAKEYNELKDTPLTHAIILCRSKGYNIYNDETGFNVERMSEAFFNGNIKECQKSWVPDCVEKYKDVASKGEMAFKTVNCLIKKKEEMKSKC